jgi:hypothetical protein
VSVVIVNGEESEPEQHAGHCPECEARFAALDMRLTAIETHHPLMDQNTSEAQETAQEALEVAQEAQETAEQAAALAVVSTLANEPAPIEETEPMPEEEVNESASTEEERIERSASGESENLRSEEESGKEKPVVLSIEPEPEPEQRRTAYRFARGRR